MQRRDESMFTASQSSLSERHASLSSRESEKHLIHLRSRHLAVCLKLGGDRSPCVLHFLALLFNNVLRHHLLRHVSSSSYFHTSSNVQHFHLACLSDNGDEKASGVATESGIYGALPAWSSGEGGIMPVRRLFIGGSEKRPRNCLSVSMASAEPAPRHARHLLMASIREEAWKPGEPLPLRRLFLRLSPEAAHYLIYTSIEACFFLC